MSQENVELARQGYEALNEALRTGISQEAIDAFCDPDIVLVPSGILPESTEMHGHDGMRLFLDVQTEAFEDFFVEPQTFIDAGPQIVVPVRFGGRARHTGLDVTFEVVHVLTARDGKWTRIDVYPSEAEALKAVGLEDERVSRENADVVRRVMRCLANAEMDAALADIHPQATLDWSNSNAPDRGVYVGHTAWRAFMQARDEALAGRRFEDVELLTPTDDTVVLVGRVQERGRASGIEVESRGAAVWTLSEGKIIRFRIYQSRDDALKAVGLEQ